MNWITRTCWVDYNQYGTKIFYDGYYLFNIIPIYIRKYYGCK
jgi:hypothetical protein